MFFRSPRSSPDVKDRRTNLEGTIIFDSIILSEFEIFVDIAIEIKFLGHFHIYILYQWQGEVYEGQLAVSHSAFFSTRASATWARLYVTSGDRALEYRKTRVRYRERSS